MLYSDRLGTLFTAEDDVLVDVVACTDVLDSLVLFLTDEVTVAVVDAIPEADVLDSVALFLVLVYEDRLALFTTGKVAIAVVDVIVEADVLDSVDEMSLSCSQKVPYFMVDFSPIYADFFALFYKEKMPCNYIQGV